MCIRSIISDSVSPLKSGHRLSPCKVSMSIKNFFRRPDGQYLVFTLGNGGSVVARPYRELPGHLIATGIGAALLALLLLLRAASRKRRRKKQRLKGK